MLEDKPVPGRRSGNQELLRRLRTRKVSGDPAARHTRHHITLSVSLCDTVRNRRRRSTRHYSSISGRGLSRGAPPIRLHSSIYWFGAKIVNRGLLFFPIG